MELGSKKRRYLLLFLLSIVVVMLFLIIEIVYKFGNKAIDFIILHDRLELDTLLFAMLTLAIGFLVYARRLLRERDAEILQRQKIEEMLQTYKDHLEKLVEKRSHQILETKKQIEEERRNLAILVDKYPDGVLLLDKEGKVLFVNPVACLLLGCKKEELLNSFLSFPIIPGETTEIEIFSATGEKRIGETCTMEIEWEGKPAYFVLIRDITERKKIDKLKNAFIAAISHELRTPLSIMKEAISLLIDGIPGELAGKQKHILDAAWRNTERLTSIIDSLFYISKIESGMMQLEKRLVNFTDLIKSTVDDFKHQAKEKGIALRYELPARAVNLYCDPHEINRVLVNLLSNAIKFTPKGKITVTCEERDHEVVVSVQDTGIGISEQDLPRVFDKFTQFNRKYGPGTKGVGLGLTISKGIIELHKGKIWVKSKPGKGSNFYFSLPKLSSDEILKERLLKGIKHALKDNSQLAAILFEFVNFKELSNQLPQRARKLLKDSAEVIKNVVEKGDDIIFTDTGEILVILTNTNREDAVDVMDEATQKLSAFISKQDMGVGLQFIANVAFYPGDASDADEMLRKLRV